MTKAHNKIATNIKLKLKWKLIFRFHVNFKQTNNSISVFALLRYLVEKILSGLASGGSQGGPSNQRAKRDLSAAASMERSGGPVLKRSRRSLDPAPQVEASLLRVKRLDDDDDDDDRTPHVSLQRMKRIDTDLPPPKKTSRKRRALTFDPAMIAQHILQYLPAWRVHVRVRGKPGKCGEGK